MSNITFAKSVDAFVATEKKGANAFGSLVEFAVSVLKEVASSDAKNVAIVLGNTIDTAEKEYRTENPKLENMPTSYRSAKSVIMSAVKNGVSLVDENGKSKGKSELETDTKEAKGDSGKTELQKFTSTMTTAASIFAKLDTLSDVQQAKELVKQLASMCIKVEAELISKAASSK
jgi:hypothetical protein